jgi:hypothetical protein
MPYIAKWQRVFRPTVLSWASTFSDPYATNTQLKDSVVLRMWDIIYPEVMLSLEERKDAGRILVYLVRVIMCYYAYSLHLFPQAGNILHDWRSTIGTGALNVVRINFLTPANRFHKERIVDTVKWALDPKKFNFIYGEPYAEVVCIVLWFHYAY